MGMRVIYVMTHDSIGLGEDGPTHQPVEHLAALRAIPNLQVIRPADAIETAECWQLALEVEEDADRPRADAPEPADPRATPATATSARAGAYILAGDAAAPGPAHRLGLGSPARARRARSAGQGRHRRRRSCRCRPGSCSPRKTKPITNEVLGADGTVRVACEAASGFGWERWLGSRGAFVGMKGFGASAKAGDLYKHFGITAEAIAGKQRARLSR